MTQTYVRKLVNYFKKNLSKGYTVEALKWALINQDYSRTAVKRALKQANKELADKAPKLKEKPKIKVKREPILEKIEEDSWKDKIKRFFRNFKEIILS